MSTSSYKNRNFECYKCVHQYKAFAWDKEGILESIPVCPKCESNESVVQCAEEQSHAPMVNYRENWKKKVPGEFKDFLGTFRKRHGRSNTINNNE